MTTRIGHNGSKWAGEAPDPVAVLLKRLTEHTLNPTFEEYGAFGLKPTTWTGEPPDYWTASMVRFWGNFDDVSAGFSIDTDEPEMIEQLCAAIRANMATQAYADSKREHAEVKP